jgi:hypothetical protein
LRLLSLLLFSFASALPAANADDAYTPLWLYNGTWEVTRTGAAKPEKLVNACALVGKYFVCQQTVNGAQGNLVIFVPTNTPGKYAMQNFTPEGRATGRTQLEINGDHWVYNNTWDQGGKTIYYKTTNVFSGKTRIHFEQLESTDNQEWKTTGGGDEVRTGPAPAKVIVR